MPSHARREALAEAGGSELQIGSDGSVTSRAGEQELFRTRLASVEPAADLLRFEKGPGHWVTLRLPEPDVLEARQPGKPLLLFERAAPARSG